MGIQSLQMTDILKPGAGTKWNKAKCIKCPATVYIRVPADEENTVYMCPTCAVTKKPKEEQD